MSRSKDIITEAYCVELKEVVDIFDAYNEFFAQNEPRRRFVFLCSDENCLQLESPPEITGVNYDKHIGKVSPHFRINPHHNHSINCSIRIINDIIQEIKKEKAIHGNSVRKNLFIDFELLESESVIDEFCTHEESTKNKRSEVNLLKQSRDQIKKSILSTPKKTSLLHKVVNQFILMSEAELKDAQIKIFNNPRTSWRNIFKKIQWIQDSQYWFHIYYGTASVYKYKDGFRIFFKNKPHYFDAEQTFDVTCFLPHDKISEDKISSETLKSLEEHAKNRSIAEYYILGKSELQEVTLRGEEKRECVVILQESFRDIVIKETLNH